MSDKEPEAPPPPAPHTPNPDVSAPENVNVFEGDNGPVNGLIGSVFPLSDQDD
jgi:hypothetical protein